MVAGEGKKREILGLLPLRGPTLRGPTVRGSIFLGLGAPPFEATLQGPTLPGPNFLGLGAPEGWGVTLLGPTLRGPEGCLFFYAFFHLVFLFLLGRKRQKDRNTKF